MILSEVAWRPPVIATQRLVLRGWEPNDAQSVYAYASDPEVSQYMAWERHRSMADAESFLNTMVAANYQKQEFDYALCLRNAEDVAIGGMGVYWNPREHLVMELGYVLAKAHWGKGLVPEAGIALIRHAFETTNVERIFAPVYAENVKSRRTAEKMGMKLEGILRSNVYMHHRRWDVAVFSILRSEVPHAGRA